MTDEFRIPAEPADARDERLAARLQTEPLDDVTRTRLVRTAMAAAEPASERRRSPARHQWLAIAAVLVVVLAIGIAVLARGDSGSGPTAARAPKAAESQTGRTAAPDTSGDSSQFNQAVPVPPGVQTLGDLGDVGATSELRGAVADVLTSKEPRPEAVPPAAGADRAPVADLGCASAALAQLGRTIAIGTGTVHGAPVTVFVVERSNGDRVAVVVDAACRVGAPVGL